MLAAVPVWKVADTPFVSGLPALNYGISTCASPRAQGSKYCIFVRDLVTCGVRMMVRRGSWIFCCQQEKQQAPPHPGSSPPQHQIFAPAACRVLQVRKGSADRA